MAAGMLYPGRVVAVEAGGPRVVVPQLGGTGRYGPLPSAVPDLAVGEAVIVSSLGTSRDQLVVLGRMAGRAPDIAEIPDLPEQLDAVNLRVDAVQIDQDTDRGVLADHETRIDGHDTRLNGIDTLNGTQNSRLTATEGVANAGSAQATNALNTADTALAANAQLRVDTASRVTTKGDLLAATAAGVLARQPAPAAGLALVADAAQATGWVGKDLLGMPKALTGATAPTRYGGGTAAGPPTTGTWAVGDVVPSADGHIYVCTAAGTPGTWAVHVGNGPRGMIARARRTTSPAVVAANAALATAGKATELSAPVLAGRQYRIGSYNVGLYTDSATQMRALLNYTIDGGTAPTSAHAIMQWAQVESPGAGRVETVPIIATYNPTTNHTVRVLLSFHATIAVAGNIGLYASPEWPFDMFIEDCGVAVAAGGTQF